MPPRTKNAIIKEEEWTRVQPIIRRLYLLEDKSLKDVIGILSTFHNFRPSKAQLGSKLKQWHMTKNMTSLEWKYVDAKIRQRRLQRKESKVYLSGIPLRLATVEKAIRHHSFESTLDRLAGKAPPSPTELSLIIRTPSPPAEVRVRDNSYNIPWLLAKDFLGGLNLAAILKPQRSSGSLQLPVHKLLSLTLHNLSELPGHTSKLQYTVQMLTLIMPEMVLETHVFFAESLLLSPCFNNSEGLEVLLFLLSNNFLEGYRFSIKDREDEAAFMGHLLDMVKRSRVLEFLVTQQLARLPLSLQSALNRLFKEAVQRSELDFIQLLIRLGVDVNQPLPGILKEFLISGAYTAFQYAVMACNQDLIQFLMKSGVDTRMNYLVWIGMVYRRRKMHPSTWETTVKFLLSNYYFDPTDEFMALSLLHSIGLDLAHQIADQIIGIFRGKIRQRYTISELLVAAVRLQSRFAFDLLSEKRQFINISNLEGETPLTAAIRIGSNHYVEHLLQLGANHSQVNHIQVNRIQVNYLWHNLFQHVPTREHRLTDTPSPLQYAAFYSDVNMVRHLLCEGADINFCHSSDAFVWVWNRVKHEKVANLGKTALQAAILGTNTEVALFLLATGARLVGGELALAIRSRQQIITEALLTEGASLGDNSAAIDCGSVLEAAVLAEDVGLILQIIQAHAEAVDERALWAAIFVAKYSSDSAIIHLVAAQYARLRVANDLWLGTAVHLAAQIGLHKISEDLLTSGMRPTSCAWGEFGRLGKIDTQTAMLESYLRWRWSILHNRELSHKPLVYSAVRFENPKYLRLLFRFGYQSPPCCPTFGMSDASLELLQILHEQGTTMTALVLGGSITSGLQLITQWLLSLNIDLNETVSDDEQWGRTPIQAAAEQGDIRLFERLLTLGADVHAPPSTKYGGVTALQAASIKGYFGLVKKMLDLHADPNAPGAVINGRTALEGAAEHGRLDVVQLLLNSGAQTSGDGRRQYVRAIEFARREGHHTVATLLKSHRPWTEADQEILEDRTLLRKDQTPEGTARWLEMLCSNSSLEEDEDEDYQDGDTVSEASEETRGPELVDAGPSIHEGSPGEVHILPLPSSTLDEIKETLRNNDAAPDLPGDAIWAEAYEDFSSEYPWLLE